MTVGTFTFNPSRYFHQLFSWLETRSLRQSLQRLIQHRFLSKSLLECNLGKRCFLATPKISNVVKCVEVFCQVCRWDFLIISFWGFVCFLGVFLVWLFGGFVCVCMHAWLGWVFFNGYSVTFSRKEDSLWTHDSCLYGIDLNPSGQ